MDVVYMQARTPLSCKRGGHVVDESKENICGARAVGSRAPRSGWMFSPSSGNRWLKFSTSALSIHTTEKLASRDLHGRNVYDGMICQQDITTSRDRRGIHDHWTTVQDSNEAMYK